MASEKCGTLRDNWESKIGTVGKRKEILVVLDFYYRGMFGCWEIEKERFRKLEFSDIVFDTWEVDCLGGLVWPFDEILKFCFDIRSVE